MAGRLAGKVAIVTGGASGIGESACRMFAREGVRGLVLADISDGPGNAIAGELQSAGVDAIYHHLDVSQEAQWVELMRAVDARWGRLDVLVNNAGRGGVITRPPIEHTTEEALDMSFAINAKGGLFGMKHAIPLMRKGGGGSIVNIASLAATYGMPFALHYTTSKAAVIGMTRGLARELGRDNIRVNAVAPSAVMTEGTREFLADKLDRGLDMIRAAQSIQRTLEPSDLSGTIAWLLGDGSGFVTGQTIAVDGGTVML